MPGISRRLRLLHLHPSFGALVALKLLNLAALTLELLLLVLNLPLLLLSRGLLVLHRVANGEAGARAKRTADSRAGERVSHRYADYRSGPGTHGIAHEAPTAGTSSAWTKRP
jgi:hypothetical protein